MKSGYIREACVETIQEALIAERLGADRLEYCADLSADGLTPPMEEILKVLDAVKIPVMVMIRPRGGDFVYSDAEFEVMQTQISAFRQTRVKGFVFGITREDRLDIERIKILVNQCEGFEVCIHKAIDIVADPVAEITELKKIRGVTRVLSSGGARTAEQGIPVLQKMIIHAGEHLSIMPAGKIKASNIESLHQSLGAREYHGRSILMHF